MRKNIIKNFDSALLLSCTITYGLMMSTVNAAVIEVDSGTARTVIQGPTDFSNANFPLTISGSGTSTVLELTADATNMSSGSNFVTTSIQSATVLIDSNNALGSGASNTVTLDASSMLQFGSNGLSLPNNIISNSSATLINLSSNASGTIALVSGSGATFTGTSGTTLTVSSNTLTNVVNVNGSGFTLKGPISSAASIYVGDYTSWDVNGIQPTLTILNGGSNARVINSGNALEMVAIQPNASGVALPNYSGQLPSFSALKIQGSNPLDLSSSSNQGFFGLTNGSGINTYYVGDGSSAGALNVTSASQLGSSTIVLGSASHSGTLTYTGNSSLISSITVGGSAANLSIISNGGSAVSIQSPMSGDSTTVLTYAGTGVTTLSHSTANAGFSGTHLISSGTALSLSDFHAIGNDTSSHVCTGITIKSGATLKIQANMTLPTISLSN